MPNLNQPQFEGVRDQPGFRCKRARLGRQAGAVELGASLWEMPPGEAAYPYHFHLGEEEMLVVLEGRPSLRTPDGWRELEQGELLAFLAGEQGAHQLMNRTEEPVRFLAISTSNAPDVVLYPDSGKLGASEGRPDGGGVYGLFRRSDEVGYYEGESPPG